MGLRQEITLVEVGIVLVILFHIAVAAYPAPDLAFSGIVVSVPNSASRRDTCTATL